MRMCLKKSLLLVVLLLFALVFCPMAMADNQDDSADIKMTTNEQVTSATANLYFDKYGSNVYLVKDGILTSETVDGTAIYDPTTNVLTLNNYNQYERHFVAENMGDDFTISLLGNSRTNGYKPFFWIKGNLTITGEGSLIAYEGDGKVVPVMRIEGNLTINNGELDLHGLGGCIICYGDITINGGNTVAPGGVDNAPGIRCASLTINNGSISSTGTVGGIYVENKIIVNGGTFESITNEGEAALQNYVMGEYHEISNCESLNPSNLIIVDTLTILAGNSGPIPDFKSYNGERYIKIFSDNDSSESPTTEPEGDIIYRTHVQNVGWQAFVEDGLMSGTTGKSLRLEGLEIKTNLEGIGIEYKTHVENIGWQDFVNDGVMSGTSGKGLRLEATQIQLTGSNASQYDVYYRVHIQNFGWTGWAKNGASCGSEGYGYRLEGIEIKIVNAGNVAPGSTTNTIHIK